MGSATSPRSSSPTDRCRESPTPRTRTRRRRASSRRSSFDRARPTSRLITTSTRCRSPSNTCGREFDGELEKLGRDLYREYVRLKDYGVSTADLEISTADDLHRLIDEVRKLSQWVEDETPRELRGPGEEAVAARTWTSSISPSRPGSVWQRVGSRGPRMGNQGVRQAREQAHHHVGAVSSSWAPRRDTIVVEKVEVSLPAATWRSRCGRFPSRRSRSSSSSSSTSRPRLCARAEDRQSWSQHGREHDASARLDGDQRARVRLRGDEPVRYPGPICADGAGPQDHRAVSGHVQLEG